MGNAAPVIPANNREGSFAPRLRLHIQLKCLKFAGSGRFGFEFWMADMGQERK
jgi:hypothetical protein